MIRPESIRIQLCIKKKNMDRYREKEREKTEMEDV